MAVARITLTVDGKPAVGRVLFGALMIFWPGNQAFLPNTIPPDSTDGSPALGQYPDVFWTGVQAFDGQALSSAQLVAQGFTLVKVAK